MVKLSHNEAMKGVLNQMNKVFHYSNQNKVDMSGNIEETCNLSSKSLKKPSKIFVGGTLWHWNPKHLPFIEGGYSNEFNGW